MKLGGKLPLIIARSKTKEIVVGRGEGKDMVGLGTEVRM